MAAADEPVAGRAFAANHMLAFAAGSRMLHLAGEKGAGDMVDTLIRPEAQSDIARILSHLLATAPAHTGHCEHLLAVAGLVSSWSCVLQHARQPPAALAAQAAEAAATALVWLAQRVAPCGGSFNVHAARALCLPLHLRHAAFSALPAAKLQEFALGVAAAIADLNQRHTEAPSLPPSEHVASLLSLAVPLQHAERLRSPTAELDSLPPEVLGKACGWLGDALSSSLVSLGALTLELPACTNLLPYKSQNVAETLGDQVCLPLLLQSGHISLNKT